MELLINHRAQHSSCIIDRQKKIIIFCKQIGNCLSGYQCLIVCNTILYESNMEIVGIFNVEW